MISNKQIRENSRRLLEHKLFGNTWLLAVVIIFIVSAVLSIAGFIPFASLVIIGPLYIGLRGSFLALVRGTKKIAIEDSINGLKGDVGGNIILGLLISIFTALWSLLFIIPGIVKSYAYSMAYFLKLDHPDWDWKACIDQSRKMMDGNKKRLFLLDLSFIGWLILGSLCFGVGTLWVQAYMETARAEFYNQLVNGADKPLEIEAPAEQN